MKWFVVFKSPEKYSLRCVSDWIGRNESFIILLFISRSYSMAMEVCRCKSDPPALSVGLLNTVTISILILRTLALISCTN